jgi:hypothetical protein
MPKQFEVRWESDLAGARFFGRDRWGWPVGVAAHLYADGVDETAVKQTWDRFLTDLYA